MPDSLLRIGELAVRASVSPRTVDYYTTLGLLTPASRTSGNYRLYDPADVDRIQLVQQLEAQGVPLEEIAEALRTRSEDVDAIMDRISDDLRALQSLAEQAPPEAHGVLAAIATRVHSLVTVALQIPPHLLP